MKRRTERESRWVEEGQSSPGEAGTHMALQGHILDTCPGAIPELTPPPTEPTGDPAFLEPCCDLL